MSQDYDLRSFDSASSDEIEDALERGETVCFEKRPVELPADEDLVFLREELSTQFKAKNVSYHPESHSVPSLDAPDEVRERATGILKAHQQRVAEFLTRSTPDLIPGWKIDTCT